MKILAIRLENLASLAGHFELDFTIPPLADQGLFAITGPTGAGKSTLLDALCLALYGSTPRLRQAPIRDSQIADVNNDTLTTADARTLLRRGCASGFAEVDFVGRDDRRYRARWAVRRARNKAEGSLQKAEQSLTDLEAGQLLTAQKREFDRLLPERLGLSFDQFTRAVLLAQSEFAAFLKADDNARSELLERLTDTQRYSAISQAAYRRVREAKTALEAIEARLADALPVDAETRAQLERHAEAQEQALATLQAQIQQQQAERTELERDAALSLAWQDAQHAWHAADTACRESQKDRETLHQLDSLVPWRAHIRRRDTLEQTLVGQAKSLDTTRAEHARVDAEYRELEPKLSTARDDRDRADKCYREAQPPLEKARQLTVEVQRLRQQMEQQTQEQHQLSEGAEADRRQHQTQSERIAQLDTRLEQQHAALQQLLAQTPTASSVQTLREALNTRRDQAQSRVTAQLALAQDWRELARIHQEHQAVNELQQAEQHRLSQLEVEGRAAKSALGTADTEFTQLHSQIEHARAARSDGVYQLRQRLQDGEPCTVCGATEHPYSCHSPDRHPPSSHPGEAMIEAIARQEQEALDAHSTQLEAARAKHYQLRADWQASHQGIQARGPQLEKLARQRQAADEALARHADAPQLLAFTERAAPDGTANTPLEWLEQRRLSTEQEQREASEQISRLDRLEGEQKPLEHERQALALTLSKVEERQTLNRQRLNALEADIPALTRAHDEQARALQACLGEYASAGAWDSALEAQRQHTRQALDAHQGRWQTLTQTHAQLAQRLVDLEQRQREAQTEFSELDSTWQTWRRDHTELSEKRLAELLAFDEGGHQSLREQISRLDRRRDEAGTKQQERRQALLDQRASLLPDMPETERLSESSTHALAERLSARQQQSDTLESQRQTQQESRDSAQHRLREDDRRRTAQREGAEARKAAQQKVDRWERLNGLIGSADGKRFRRIAQAYNLDHLLTHANQHLRALTPRYRLTRGGSELGILVIDGDMADEQRSVHSLSGGETFLVSLALALGLASMASHQLAIESLFIDEGFGSLDPQSLALAMDALDGLQAQGRRVGVISHVQEMHERIPMQIRIEPRGNGASQLVLKDAKTA